MFAPIVHPHVYMYSILFASRKEEGVLRTMDAPKVDILCVKYKIMYYNNIIEGPGP